jgi:Tfp pilus assembly protein PilV
MTNRTPSRARLSRSGMTLTEVLFAMGILLVGVLSIMSLVPVAIHQVTTSSDNTLGAAIGQSVIVSLQNGQLDMGNYEVDTNIHPNPPDYMYRFNDFYRSPDALPDTVLMQLDLSNTHIEADTDLYSYGNWPNAIYALHRDRIDDGQPGFGNGGTVAGGIRPSFTIPGDTPIFINVTWEGLVDQSAPQLVPVPWAQDYYWSATFLPISADDDLDSPSDYDDDPYVHDSGLGHGTGGTDDLIMPGTNYRVQVAVWRWVNPNSKLMLYDASDNITGDWQVGSNTVTNLSNDIRLANQFDYIRMDDYGVWYRIGEYDFANAPDTVTLVTPFQHPDSGAFNGRAISVASDFKLVGVYEAIVESSDLGGTP